MNFIENKKYKILTPTGYQFFDGIRKTEKDCVEITTDMYTLSCSTDHLVFISDEIYKPVSQLFIGEPILDREGKKTYVTSIRRIGKLEVYDAVNVASGSKYYTGDILSHNCQFHHKGEASIDVELFEEFKKHCREPEFELEQDIYKIWAPPSEDKIYVVGVDISEGVGQNYSVIQVLDITDLTTIEQVAVYRNNVIDPSNFTTKLNEVLQQWGKPLVIIERNNCGSQVVDNLRNMHQYENIVSYGAELAGRKKNLLGAVAHTNTKGRGVLNMRYWVNTLKAVRFNDIQTLMEMKDFVRKPNGTWSARGTVTDDSVMALMWALVILDNDVQWGVTNEYFEVIDIDENGKPKQLKPLDYGLKYFTRSQNKTYDLFKETLNAAKFEDGSVLPLVFGSTTQLNDDMADLELQGWKLL